MKKLSSEKALANLPGQEKRKTTLNADLERLKWRI